MNQPLAHTKDPITSHEAADRLVESGELTKQENEVWETIKYHVNNTFYKTFTAKELVGWRKLDYHLIQRRLSGLRNKGRIERVSVNNNGKPPWVKRNKCCVWRLK